MIIYYTSFLKCEFLGEQPREMGLNAFEPERAIGIDPGLYGSQEQTHSINNYSRCPAYIDYFNNLFYIKSSVDYNFYYNQKDSNVYSTMYDQNYFNKFVKIRDIKEKLFTFTLAYIFLTDEKELIITQEPVPYKTNEFLNNTVLIPGSYDVAKWPRPLELAFHLKGNGFEMNQGDVLYGLRFHTKEKITFKRFYMTPKFADMMTSLLNVKTNFKIVKTLGPLYDVFTNKNRNLKNLMIKEAKENLLD